MYKMQLKLIVNNNKMLDFLSYFTEQSFCKVILNKFKLVKMDSMHQSNFNATIKDLDDYCVETSIPQRQKIDSHNFNIKFCNLMKIYCLRDDPLSMQSFADECLKLIRLPDHV